MNFNEALMIACKEVGVDYFTVARRGKPSELGKKARELANKILSKTETTIDNKSTNVVRDSYEDKYEHLKSFDWTKQKPLHNISREEMLNAELIIPNFLRK